MIVRLTVVAPESGRGTFSLRLPFAAGRAPDAKLRVQHERVSRRHCEFFEEEGTVYLRDLGSTNGTLVDDVPVDPALPVALAPGAVISLGHVSIRIEYDPFAEAPTAALDAATAARLGVAPTAASDATTTDGITTDGITTDMELERFLRRLTVT